MAQVKFCMYCGQPEPEAYADMATYDCRSCNKRISDAEIVVLEVNADYDEHFAHHCSEAWDDYQWSLRKGATPERFYELAEMLNNIMGEEIYRDVPDFEMPEIAIMETAEALYEGFKRGDIKDNEHGALYYSGMIDAYAGPLDSEYIRRKI